MHYSVRKKIFESFFDARYYFVTDTLTAADKLLKLTEVMARHSFSVTDMRNYFRLLRDTFEKKNMPHLEKLLRSFQSMCYKRGPAAVFDFDGEKSCVSNYFHTSFN